jgi:hypothetical protein
MSPKNIEKYDASRLQNNMSLGMEGVDKADIRPPTVLLIQAISKKADFMDAEGKNPKEGQFFHNGTLKILDSFECYFVWAAKGQIENKREPEEGPLRVYRAIGVMADDFSVFGMIFKSSSLYALTPLFTAVSAKKRGMYTIRCKVEAKFIKGQKNEWYVPTVKVAAFEDEAGKLIALEALATQYAKMAGRGVVDEDGSGSDDEEPLEAGLEPTPEKEKNDEKIETSEIPF